MLTIRRVEPEDNLDPVKDLFQEYAEWRPNDPALSEFPEEMKELPGRYGPPGGSIILAYWNDVPVGCVAVHALEEGVCEMKRLYVKPDYRGKRIGRQLAEAIFEEARKIGYSLMRLDSIPKMREAQALYESMGFYQISPYRNNPNVGTRYYEIKLI